jgi:DnaA-homolog protein
MRQLVLELSAPPEPLFENFVPGRNAELVAALRALAQGGGERFIYTWGGQGSGRSHLLRATVAEARRAGRDVILVVAPAGAETFDAAAADQMLALDDTERLDAAAQRALFGLYNRIREGGGALIASGASAPTAIGVREDLATRLAWGLVYEVHALSDDEKAEAMSARAGALGFSLPADALAYVLRHGRRDLPSLLATVDLLDRYSLETRRAVTLPLAREVLRLAPAGTEAR